MTYTLPELHVYIEDGVQPETATPEWYILEENSGLTVATVPYDSGVRNGEVSLHEALQKAQAIVRAVNSHDALLEIAREAQITLHDLHCPKGIPGLEHYTLCEKMQTAIAQAER